MSDPYLTALYVTLRCLWQADVHLDMVQGAMTVALVPKEQRGYHRARREDSDYYAKDNEQTLALLREIFAGLIGKRMTIAGPIALPFRDGWFEHQAEYGPHGLTGRLVGVDGFVLDYEDVLSDRPLPRRNWPKHFRYCLIFETTKNQITEAPFGIWWQEHPETIDRALVPVEGLSKDWWHTIHHIEKEGN